MSTTPRTSTAPVFWHLPSSRRLPGGSDLRHNRAISSRWSCPDSTLASACPPFGDVRARADSGGPGRSPRIDVGASTALPSDAGRRKSRKQSLHFSLTKPRYPAASLVAHAPLGVRASPRLFRRTGGFPGSHGPDPHGRIHGLTGRREGRKNAVGLTIGIVKTATTTPAARCDDRVIPNGAPTMQQAASPFTVFGQHISRRTWTKQAAIRKARVKKASGKDERPRSADQIRSKRF